MRGMIAYDGFLPICASLLSAIKVSVLRLADSCKSKGAKGERRRPFAVARSKLWDTIGMSWEALSLRCCAWVNWLGSDVFSIKDKDDLRECTGNTEVKSKSITERRSRLLRSMGSPSGTRRLCVFSTCATTK